MAIVLSGSNRTSFLLVSSASLELPFGVGDDRLLTVGVFQRNAVLYTASLFVGGSSLTLVNTIDNTVPANDLRSQIFFIPNHPTSSCTLTACFSGDAVGEIQASWWTGANSSPLDIFGGESGSSGTALVTASQPTDGNSMIFGALIHDAAAAATPISPSTIFNFDNGAWGTNTGYIVQSTAASQNIDWTLSASDYWSLGYAVFKSSAGTNASPTIVTNTASGISFGTTTPTLEFTGSDDDSDDLVYEIKIASNDEMSASGTQVTAGLAASSSFEGSGGFHENGLSSLTWQGYYQVDDRFGISFLGNGGILNKVSTVIETDASSTNGYALARIYAHEGTFGVDGTPLNPASASNTPTPGWLAQSASIYYDASSLTRGWKEFVFSGSDQIRLQNETPYFVIFDWIPLTPDYDNLIEFAQIDSSSFAGNMYIDGNSANNGVYAPADMLFRVYEDGILLEKSSASHAGFLNTVTASDTSPFTAGDKISYTIQSGEELDTDATYFWSVRAVDPNGSGTWTEWTTPISFIVGGTTLVVSGGTHSHAADNVVLTEDSGITIGSTAWGHSSGVIETNVRTFSGNWTGTGSTSGTGDAEIMSFVAGEYMESEIVETGVFNIELLQNVYASGDTLTLKYRHASTSASCLSASWLDYTTPFLSDGYVQLRMEG